MSKYQHVHVPEQGHKIGLSEDGRLEVPLDPIIPFIEGDGIGPDIWRASKRVFDAAVEKAYAGRRKVSWMEIYAGEKANDVYGADTWLPEETNEVIREFIVAIKGPLTTPIGGGIRSLNVALRQAHDLYACVRPVRYFRGVPSPVKEPEKLDIVIYRENTEDVYAGIEFESGGTEADELISALRDRYGKRVRDHSAIGIKPISEFASRRLVRRAIQYAIDHKRSSVTLMHKGNIMKFTEGAFRDWGYRVAEEEFGDVTVSEKQIWERYDGKAPEGKIVVKDRIADMIFQQLLLRPDEYEVIACPNLNGDYISDAAAAQVGGLGLAPGANIGDRSALFEATHGTAPKYTGQDKVNPGSLILSGALMFEHIGWTEVSEAIVGGIERAIGDKQVTYDLERQMHGATLVSCSGFGEAIVERM